MYYVIQITTDTEGAEARAITPFETETEAVAKFHNEMGYAMNNEAVMTALVQAIDSTGRIVKTEYFARPVVQPDPEPVVEPEENS